MKWILRLHQGSPGLAEVLPFALSSITLPRIVTVQPTRCRLQVEQFRKRSPDRSITVVSKSQAKIDVIEGHRQIDLIESANLEEYRTTNCGAGAGHRRKCARQRQLTEMAGITPT